MSGLARWAGAVLMAGAFGFIDGHLVPEAPSAFMFAGLFGAFLIMYGSRRPGWDARRTAAGILLAVALMTMLQIVGPPLLARHHRVPAGAGAIAAVLGWIGLDAGVGGAGNLLLMTGRGTHEVAITSELLALPCAARIVAVLIVVGGGTIGRALGVVALATIIRAIAMIGLSANGASASVFHEPAITLAGFLPLALAAPRRVGPEIPRLSARAAGAGGLALLVVAGAGLGHLHGYRASGRARAGRVLIDESHSRWEPAGTAFDHSLHGQASLYNYALWRAWIELHHETRVIGTEPGQFDLEGADVLIVKTPTSPYPRDLVDRIERFVRSGGGLLLIGDHTNLFGMSTVLNGLAAPYGIAFRHDDTYPLDHEASDLFRPPRLAPHPVLRGLDVYPFETSCTLEISWRAEALMIGRRLGAEPADHGHPNFFGNMLPDPSEPFGLFVQAAVLDYGAGRVAAFSDSTNFSNFSMLWPGRRELTLNLIDWLNRAPPGKTARALRGLTGGAALAALVVGVAWLVRAGAIGRAAAAWSGLLSFAIAAHAGAWLAARAIEPTPARGPVLTAAFDTDLSAPRLEPVSPVLTRAAPRWDAYNAFFIDAARSGLWPVPTDDLVGALTHHDLVVLAEPRRAPDRRHQDALRSFFDRGGRLLVLDSASNRGSTAGELLEPLGVRARRDTVRHAAGTVPVISPEGVAGERPAALPGGAMEVTRAVGRGRVMLVTDAAIFSDGARGGVYVTPREGDPEIREGQRELFRRLGHPGRQDGP